MRPTRQLTQLAAAAALATGAVYLMAGPASDLFNSPLAILGMGLIGLGLIRKSKENRPAEA